MDEAKNQINDLEPKEAKSNHTEQQQEKRIHKDSINSLWDNFKMSNIHIKGMPEGEEKGQEIGNLPEKLVKENYPNLVKEIDMQDQEVQRMPIMVDAKRPTPRHVIIKRPKVKDKERLLKATREKKLFTRWLPDGSGERETG